MAFKTRQEQGSSVLGAVWTLSEGLLLPQRPHLAQAVGKGRGAEGQGCSCWFPIPIFLLQLLLRPLFPARCIICLLQAREPCLCPETFPCISQTGKAPSQRKTQHAAKGRRSEGSLHPYVLNSVVVLKGRKILHAAGLL